MSLRDFNLGWKSEGKPLFFFSFNFSSHEGSCVTTLFFFFSYNPSDRYNVLITYFILLSSLSVDPFTRKITPLWVTWVIYARVIPVFYTGYSNREVEVSFPFVYILPFDRLHILYSRKSHRSETLEIPKGKYFTSYNMMRIFHYV